MQERDAHLVRAGSRRFIDHANPGPRQLGDPVLDARDRVGDVMETVAPFFKEGRDRAGRIGRLQQFEADVTDPEERDADTLVGDFLDPFEDRPEFPLVEGALGFDRIEQRCRCDGLPGLGSRRTRPVRATCRPISCPGGSGPLPSVPPIRLGRAGGRFRKTVEAALTGLIDSR